jgi:hypothetical protein
VGDVDIFWAIRAGSSEDVFNVLKLHPQQLELRNLVGETPLLHAARHNQFECLTYLLSRGADAFAIDYESGWNALHFAMYFGNFRVIKALKDSSVYRDLAVMQDNEGLHPFDLIQSRFKHERGEQQVEDQRSFVSSFGYGGNMQLGYPVSGDFREKAKILSMSLKTQIHSLSIGIASVGAITSRGELYTWGVGKFGRLGHGDETSHIYPKKVDAFSSTMVVDVSMGESHSLALTSLSSLFLL